MDEKKYRTITPDYVKEMNPEQLASVTGGLGKERDLIPAMCPICQSTNFKVRDGCGFCELCMLNWELEFFGQYDPNDPNHP